jgi:multimeric flavodoxin WrbA
MRVLAIVGSPEPGGKSAASAASVLVGARGEGADTELVELAGTTTTKSKPPSNGRMGLCSRLRSTGREQPPH